MEEAIQSGIEIHYIRQKEPFAVLLGDDIIKSEKTCLKQLLERYVETHFSIVGVQKVEDRETHYYGVIDYCTVNGRRYEVNRFVEKPI